MKRPVSLTVHRNKIEKRRRKERVRDMVTAAKGMAAENDLIAYAIVGVTKEGNATAAWDTGAHIPMWAFPSVVYRVLDHELSAYQEDEDFLAPVQPER